MNAGLEARVYSQNFAEPDPLSLTHRSLIKDTERAVVLRPQADAQKVLNATLSVALPLM